MFYKEKKIWKVFRADRGCQLDKVKTAFLFI